jgi:xylulokinase
MGVGLYKNEQDAFQHVYRPGRTYEPDLSLASKYADWFEVYKQLYPALRSISHQLYDRFWA